MQRNLIIGTPNTRRILSGGETVRFYIIQALHPLWVSTPFADYPVLPDEELSITLPDTCCVYPVNFICGEERIQYRFVVS